MRKSKLVFLSSILMCSALTPAASAASHHLTHLHGHLGARLADPDRFPGLVQVSRHPKSAEMPSTKPAQLDLKYTIIDHPNAGGAPGQGTRVWGINDNGLISGQYRDSDSVMHAFLLSPDLKTFTTWQVGTYFTTASFGGPDKKGEVAGSYFDDGGVEHGYLRLHGGRISTFDVPGCIDGVEVFAINGGGTVVGSCFDENFVVHGFLRSREGAITLIDEPNAGADADEGTFPEGINDSGEVVGRYLDSGNVLHAFIYSGGAFTTEYDAPGAGTNPGQGTDAWIILNDGTIAAGYADSSDIYHGYIRHPDGTFIAPIDVPDSQASEMQGLKGNLSVGDYFDADGTDHGFIRNGKGKIRPFDAPGSGTGDGLGTSPAWMNKNRVVAGWFLDDNDVRHGFLMTR